MASGRARRRVTLVAGVGSLVVVAVVGLLHRADIGRLGDLGSIEPRPDSTVEAGVGPLLVRRESSGGPSTAAGSASLSAAQQRVLAEVPGSYRSGSVVVVPAVLGELDAGVHDVLPTSQLAGRVAPLGTHAYSVPWDWTGLRGPIAPALRAPAPGNVVADLGPAYVACHVRYQEALTRTDPCLMATVVHDDAGRWRIVESWAGRATWPYGPHSPLEVRIATDLRESEPAYFVSGAVHGRAGGVRMWTRTGALETATLDVKGVSPRLTTFWALLPEPPGRVRTYDTAGHVGSDWTD